MAMKTVVTGFIVAVLAKLFADDIKAWLSWIAQRLVSLAVRQLPPGDYRDRYSEEWQSHIGEIPGEIGKVFGALGLLLGAFRIVRFLNAGRPKWLNFRFRHTIPFGAALGLIICIVAYQAYQNAGGQPVTLGEIEKLRLKVQWPDARPEEQQKTPQRKPTKRAAATSKHYQDSAEHVQVCR